MTYVIDDVGFILDLYSSLHISKVYLFSENLSVSSSFRTTTSISTSSRHLQCLFEAFVVNGLSFRFILKSILLLRLLALVFLCFFSGRY